MKFSMLSKTLLVTALAFGLTYANTEDADEDMIITSKPHNMPRLMTLQTSEVLESYGLGFAGSGNVHSIFKGSHDAMTGAIYLGLGDVAELGYDVEQLRMKEKVWDKRMNGHLKIKFLSEGKYLPSFGVTYGQNVAEEVEIGDSIPFHLDRQSVLLSMGKSIQIGDYNLSVYPGVRLGLSQLTQYGEVAVPVKEQHAAKSVGYQLGATWQSSEKILFMLESRQVQILDQDKAELGDLAYGMGFENNLGVRFYLRNWLFVDAGLLTTYDMNDDLWDTGIHANISGLIPLKSVTERLVNYFEK